MGEQRQRQRQRAHASGEEGRAKREGRTEICQEEEEEEEERGEGEAVEEVSSHPQQSKAKPHHQPSLSRGKEGAFFRPWHRGLLWERGQPLHTKLFTVQCALFRGRRTRARRSCSTAAA